MKEKIAYWRWLWRQEFLWFLRAAPRKEWDTRIYEGLPGSGKTLLMVRDCCELMRQGVRVYANVQIRDPYSGCEALPLGGWLDMLRASVKTLEDGIPTMFAFDEIHLACDARSWQNTPAWWLNLMAQRRHYGVGLIGTTQNADAVEKRLRMLIGRIVRVRPTILRKWWWRLPLFSTQDVDMSLVDVPDQDSVSAGALTWIGAHGFHGYSTSQLMATLDFSALTDDEATAEIAELTARAQAFASPGLIAAFGDPEWSPAPDGVAFGYGVEPVSYSAAAAESEGFDPE